MAGRSALKAVQDFYDTVLVNTAFPNSSKPSIWLDEAPTQQNGGGYVYPYCILKDGKGTYDWSPAQGMARLPGSFTITAYYADLGDAAHCIDAILFNGQATNLKAGLAFAQLTLDLPRYALQYSVTPTFTQEGYARQQDKDGNRVHFFTQGFDRFFLLDPKR